MEKLALIAAAQDEGDLLKQVLSQRDDGSTALHLVATFAPEHPEFVDFFAAASDVDATDGAGNTPLILAAERGFASIVGKLLQHGADVNKARESDGVTPLLAAIQNIPKKE